MGGLVGDGNPGVTETAPGIGFDAQRGSGLPLCKRDAYHNRAFQLMSRMCQEKLGDMNICYPGTRVVMDEQSDWSQGSFLNGRFYLLR